MSARRTNSLAASLDGKNSPSDTLPHAESSVPSSLASGANSGPQTSSTVSAPVVATGVHDPALITVIVDAVKASLAAEKGPGPTSSNLRGNSVSMELQAAFGGVPTPSPSSSRFSPRTTQRQLLGCKPAIGTATPTAICSWPSFSSILAKTVSQIVAGKYVDLGDLLSVNIVQTEPESQAFLDGRLVFLPSAKKQHQHIKDIVTWSEAFTIFTLILTSHFPHRWKDLTSYKLLILRTYCQFSSRVWLAYDQAFHQHAAATKLVDWSTMNIQLYNFHAAGPLCILGLVVPWVSYPNNLERTPPRSFAGRGTGAAVRHKLLRVGLPITAALVRVSTVRQNAPVILTKHLHTIANADLLLLPPYHRLPQKPGVSGCAFFCFPGCFFLPCLICADCL